MNPTEHSVDDENPKYRQLKRGSDVLEYSVEPGELTIDWVCGKNASSMIRTILAIDGEGVTKISGYVTDKLGDASDYALQRLGNRIASQIGNHWESTIQKIEGRRYFILLKRETP